jgi:uncharacterized protein
LTPGSEPGAIHHAAPAAGTARRFAYIHGFASGPMTKKGRALAEAFRRHGLELALPDLNIPTFGELTYWGMLAGVDALDARHGEGPWGFVGSSMGGWVAARWAELHPERVAALVLLAPGFDLPERWRQLITAEQLAGWQRQGWIEANDGAGTPDRLHWGFMEDARRQPPFPEPACPTLILHGRRDPVVPIEVSEAYARARPHVELEVLDDDHDLLVSLPTIEARALAWLAGIGAGP